MSNEKRARAHPLDRPGVWEIRVTVYRNGKRVGTCDTAGWEAFDDAAYCVGENLSIRGIDLHVPRRRDES